MKRKLTYTLIVVLAALIAGSCQQEQLRPESVIKDSTVTKNSFDQWLQVNFLQPYNIDFRYRYTMAETDFNYYNVPPQIEGAIIYAHLVKYLCVDTYDEVAGLNFTRSYFPKMFYLNGTWQFRNNGSITLGTAEAGKKIMLGGVNYLEDVFASHDAGRITDAELEDHLNHYYIKTIHHEFTHILNQTKEYSEAFTQVTPSTYVGDACFDTDDYWLGRGYITAYSQSEPAEDFAELLSEYVTHSAAWWDQQLATAKTQTTEVRKSNPNAPEGNTLIQSKIDMVRDYMEASWNIDIDVLRSVILRRFQDVSAGRVDVHTTAI